MMNLSRAAIALLTSALVLGIGADAAVSQVRKPGPSTPPAVETWRAPLSRFLQEAGMQNAESLAASTKATSLGGDPEAFALRLEDASTCLNDICLTIVASIANGELASPVMLFAPKAVTRGEASAAFLGSASTPRITFSQRSAPRDGDPAISVLRTQKGWIIVPQ